MAEQLERDGVYDCSEVGSASFYVLRVLSYDTSALLPDAPIVASSIRGWLPLWHTGPEPVCLYKRQAGGQAVDPRSSLRQLTPGGQERFVT